MTDQLKEAMAAFWGSFKIVGDNLPYVGALSMLDFVGQYVQDFLPRGNSVAEARLITSVTQGFLDAAKFAAWEGPPTS